MRDWWKSLTVPQALLIIFGACILLAAAFCVLVFLSLFPFRTSGGPTVSQPTPVIILGTPTP